MEESSSPLAYACSSADAMTTAPPPPLHSGESTRVLMLT
jgi:hypothetical protein